MYASPFLITKNLGAKSLLIRYFVEDFWCNSKGTGILQNLGGGGYLDKLRAEAEKGPPAPTTES